MISTFWHTPNPGLQIPLAAQYRAHPDQLPFYQPTLAQTHKPAQRTSPSTHSQIIPKDLFGNLQKITPEINSPKMAPHTLTLSHHVLVPRLTSSPLILHKEQKSINDDKQISTPIVLPIVVALSVATLLFAGFIIWRIKRKSSRDKKERERRTQKGWCSRF